MRKADNLAKRRDDMRYNENSWGGDFKDYANLFLCTNNNCPARRDQICDSIPANTILQPADTDFFVMNSDGTGPAEDANVRDSYFNIIFGVKPGCLFTLTKAYCLGMFKLLTDNCLGLTNGHMVWGGGVVSDNCGFLSVTNGDMAKDDMPMKDMVASRGWVRYVAWVYSL